MTITGFTFAEGDTIRIDDKHPGRVMKNNLNGTVDIWTSRGMRTVTADRIGPPKIGDVVGSWPKEWAAPKRKRGQR